MGKPWGEQLILTILTKIKLFHLDYHQRRRWTPCIFMVENWTACAIRRFWKSNGRSKIHHLETSQEKWHCLEFWKILDWQKWQSYQKIQQELSNCPYFQRHFKLGLIFDPSFFKGSYVNMWLEYYHISMIWLIFFLQNSLGLDLFTTCFHKLPNSETQIFKSIGNSWNHVVSSWLIRIVLQNFLFFYFHFLTLVIC